MRLISGHATGRSSIVSGVFVITWVDVRVANIEAISTIVAARRGRPIASKVATIVY